MAIRSTPTLVTAPTSEPVTLAEVKAWMKVDATDEDALISSLIAAARDSAEKFLRKALMPQTWALTVDLPASNLSRDLPEGMYDLPVSALYGDLPMEFDLPYKPIRSITSVVTYSTANASTTYSSSYYFLDTASGRLILNDTAIWPSGMRNKAAVVITYANGYANAAAIPQSIKSAIMMHVQRMYDERIVCDLPESCSALLRQHREYSLNG